MTSDPVPVAPAPAISLPYGEDPGQVADVWLPATPSQQRGRSRPWLVLIHGDFWTTAEDVRQMHPLAAALAAHGYTTIAIEYRRVGQPGGGWPGTLDDVARAVRMAPQLARRALEPAGTAATQSAGALVEQRPVLIGHAAGGHLALWAARRAPARAVLALAPVADLFAAYRGGHGAAVSALLGGGPDEVPDRYTAADPATMLPMGIPVAILHGAADERVALELSHNFMASARRAGDGITLRELPGVRHGELIDPASAAWPAVLAALTALA